MPRHAAAAAGVPHCLLLRLQACIELDHAACVPSSIRLVPSASLSYRGAPPLYSRGTLVVALRLERSVRVVVVDVPAAAAVVLVSPCRHVLWHGLLSYCDLPCHYLLCHYVLTYLLGAPLGKTMRYVWGDWEYATLPHAFQPYPHPYPYP